MKKTDATITLKPYKIWVLVPHLESNDPNLQYYYDFTQSHLEYTKVFDELKAVWQWQLVTMKNYKQVIRSIAANSENKIPLVLNLCDGDEINGTPGISVIHELEKNKLIYTGSDEYFYNITTSKIPMKKAFDKSNISTANWRVINGKKGSIRGICKRVGTPIIIKPAVSGGSMGVSVKNVVHTEEELSKRIEEIKGGYHGWNLLADGLFVEQYISGAEFTTFITGSSDDQNNCVVYEPVERVFHKSLPETEKFLSFGRLWEIYDDEAPMPQNENFYEYKSVDLSLVSALKDLSIKAYKACGGKGYARLDIRMDSATGTLFMLEVNAQCGLSEDENYTSIGAILKASNKTFTEIILEILKDALRREVAKVVPEKRPEPTKSKKTVAIK